jgi:ABC-type transporter Mla subunit MlaD
MMVVVVVVMVVVVVVVVVMVVEHSSTEGTRGYTIYQYSTSNRNQILHQNITQTPLN